MSFAPPAAEFSFDVRQKGAGEPQYRKWHVGTSRGFGGVGVRTAHYSADHTHHLIVDSNPYPTGGTTHRVELINRAAYRSGKPGLGTVGLTVGPEGRAIVQRSVVNPESPGRPVHTTVDVPPASPELRAMIAAHHDNHAWMPLLDKLAEEYPDHFAAHVDAHTAGRNAKVRQRRKPDQPPAAGPQPQVREKAMCLSSDDAGGVFREEKAAGTPVGVVPMPVNTSTLPPGVRPAGVYEYKCPLCGGRAYNGDPETGGQFRGGGRCHDCGGGFSIVGMKLQPVSDVPVKTVNMPNVQMDPSTADDPASTQIDLPPDVAAVLVRLGETIPDDHLAKGGLEKVPHVTCRYGLTCGVGPVLEAVKDFGAIHYQLGQFKVFAGKKHDVLWADVISPELHQLHAVLKRLPGVESDHKEYTPHVTIAYLQPGLGEVYAAAWNGVVGLDAQLLAKEITYSGPDRVPVTVSLCCREDRAGAVSAVEQVREKSHNPGEPGYDSDDDSDDTMPDDPAVHELIQSAVDLLGGREPDHGPHGNAVLEFARHLLADPDRGRAVAQRLVNDPEARRAVVAQLSAHAREKGMGPPEGEGVPPVGKPAKAKKAPAPKKAKPPEPPASADRSVEAEKPAAPPADKPSAEPAAEPTDPPAVPQPGKGKRPKQSWDDTHRAIHDIARRANEAGGATEDHVAELAGHFLKHTNQELHPLKMLLGMPKSAAKTHAADTIARRLLRAPAKPEGGGEPPAEQPPASSGLDALLGHLMGNPHVGRQVAQHVNTNPQEAEHLAAGLAAEPPPAEPPPAEPPPVDAPLAKPSPESSGGEPSAEQVAEKPAEPQSYPGFRRVTDEVSAGGPHWVAATDRSGKDVSGFRTIPAGQRYADLTAEMAKQGRTVSGYHLEQRPTSQPADRAGVVSGEQQKPQTTFDPLAGLGRAADPFGTAPKSRTPTSIPGVDRFEDDGEDGPDGTREMASARPTPEQQSAALGGPGRSRAGATPPTGGQPAADQPAAGGRTEVSAGGGHTATYTDKQGREQTADMNIPAGQSFQEFADHMAKQFGWKVTGISAKQGGGRWEPGGGDPPPDGGKPAGGGRRAAGDNPHNWTPTQRKLADILHESGHGVMGRHNPGTNRFDVTDNNGQLWKLTGRQVGELAETGEYPHADRQTWPLALGNAATAVEGMGHKVVGLAPGGNRVLVQGPDGRTHAMTAGDVDKSVAAGKLQPAGHQRQAHLDDLSQKFEQMGLGTLVSHLKAAGVYHFRDQQGADHYLTPAKVRQALSTRKIPPAEKPPQGRDADRVRHLLASTPHLGELKAVFSIGNQTRGRRYHVRTPDGVDHYPTFEDIQHAKRFGQYPPTEQFEEAGLGKVHERLSDGTLHVVGQDGKSRLLTSDEMRQAIADGRLPSVAAPVRPDPSGGVDLGEWVDRLVSRMLQSRGLQPWQAEEMHTFWTKTVGDLVKRYGNDAQLWKRLAEAARNSRGFFGTNAGTVQAALQRAFADHPVNTGRRPSQAKDVKAAMAWRKLGTHLQANADGTHLVVGPDGRGRLLEAADVHRALDTGKLPPARQLPPTGNRQPQSAQPQPLPLPADTQPLPLPPSSPQQSLASHLRPLPTTAQRKVDEYGRRLSAAYPKYKAAVEAITRNDPWVRKVAAAYAHKVAHRFGGDVKRAEAALYDVVRHLAHSVHLAGVGATGRTSVNGVRVRLTRKKGFDPAAFADNCDPMAAITGLLAS